jgi:hypothetical protein
MNKYPISLADLPSELWQETPWYLTVPEILRLAQTSKDFHAETVNYLHKQLPRKCLDTTQSCQNMLGNVPTYCISTCFARDCAGTLSRLFEFFQGEGILHAPEYKSKCRVGTIGFRLVSDKLIYLYHAAGKWIFTYPRTHRGSFEKLAGEFCSALTDQREIVMSIVLYVEEQIPLPLHTPSFRLKWNDTFVRGSAEPSYPKWLRGKPSTDTLHWKITIPLFPTLAKHWR